jgi:Tfp pilus assembly protein PilZ
MVRSGYPVSDRSGLRWRVAVRVELRLSSHSEWLKVFDPRDWTVVVPATAPYELGTSLRIDLDVGGWLVTLRGTAVGRREDPAAVVVALGGAERDKINYLNGFVRGGLLNLREKRRLPLRLEVTYGAIEGPAKTLTKDINEEGLFLFTDRPLPETSQVHMLLSLPGRADPLSLVGKVSHTIIAIDDEPPGMGIVFELDDAGRAQLLEIVGQLERQLHAGMLPTAAME